MVIEPKNKAPAVPAKPGTTPPAKPADTPTPTEPKPTSDQH